jgi:protein transport protein SEC61 subunit gamma and related proteins
MFKRLKSFFYECVRVFKVTKKPSSSEFKVIVKVSGIGILVIGILGFIVNMVWSVVS